MSVLIHGNTEQNIPGQTGGFNHSQQAGSDKYLFAVVLYQTTRNIVSLTYNSVGMTFLASGDAGNTRTWALYGLDNPADGLNTITLNLDLNPTYDSHLWCVSFTQASGVKIGNIGVNAALVVNPVRTFANPVDATSVVLAGALAPGAITSYPIEIPTGVSSTNLHVEQVVGVGNYSISRNTSPVSGTIQVKYVSPFPSSLWSAEIEEAGGGGPVARRGRFIIT